MRTRSLGSRILAAVLCGPLAAATLGAQGTPPPRFGLGATEFVGELTGNGPGPFVGLEGFVRLTDSALFRARVDGALYGAAGPPAASGCPLSSGGSCGDPRHLSNFGTVMVTALMGPRLSSGIRPIYLLLGVGGAVSTWASGTYFWNNEYAKHAAKLGPTVAMAQGGIGSEFRLFGADRIELRLHLTPAGGGGTSIALGHVW